MKIAFVTDDGTTVSAHFGRATQYMVVTVEGGSVTSRALIPKPAHHSASSNHEHHEHGEGEPGHGQHGHGHAQAMLEPVMDCAMLVTRGMGQHAYEAAQAAGLEPVVTELANIDDVIAAHAAGNLENHVERLH